MALGVKLGVVFLSAGAMALVEEAPAPQGSAEHRGAPSTMGEPDPPAHPSEEEHSDLPPAPAPAPTRVGKHPPLPVPKVSPKVVEQDGMLRLPGGRFIVGSIDRNAPLNEKPSRPAFVGAFFLDKVEVTVGAYKACVERGACAIPVGRAKACTYALGEPLLPVSCVRWTDADRYCRAVDKRLPTELEWEFAARGVTMVRYPWGNQTDCQHATTLVNDQTGRSCVKDHPQPVGSHPLGTNPFGVLDLIGNVEEWTSDWYVERPGAGPAPRSGASHVLRGGGWLSQPGASKTTSRNWGSAMEAGPNVGFRCARDAR